MRNDLIKTKFPGVYYIIDPTSKVKTYFARIKIIGLVNTDQIVGYSNDEIRTNPSIAYQKRNELIASLKSGKPLNKKITLQALFDEYIKHATLTQRKSTLDTKVYYFKKHFLKLSKKNITDIKTSDLQNLISSLLQKGYAPQTAKHQRNLIKAILNYAIKKRYIEINPAQNIEIPKFNNERKFFIEDEKAKMLYEEILDIPNNSYRLMFLFLLRGRRKGEILSLEWQDIDFYQKSYTIRDENNKISESQKYLLDDELLEHFTFLERGQKGLVFPSPITGKKMTDFPRSVWREMKNKLGLKMRLHDFRHLLGFTLVNNNIPLEIISKTLGHKSIKTTQRYSNMKEEMAKLGSDTFLDLLKK
ncbi:site-specific integrase [Sulfurospirillum sp. T05]|uniref:Site-specific integrase n=1 Tax=Sulfurospirillum tamanense TaxID=2813362 RepID=A0ABS2WQ69_9BACT|nr:site-specific integrase [Sulfurospirillum tamanensis]MBN2963837.1 site-specific integrase [Sulfurospirillum tamanensis]